MQNQSDLPALLPPHISNMREVYQVALRELAKPYPSFLLKRWPIFNRMVGGLRMREFSILCGPTGCLGGDSMVRINRAGKGSQISIRDLYNRTHGIADNRVFDPEIPTYVRSYDGRMIVLQKIKGVHLSGIKETWRLRTAQHHDLRLTPCHRVMTERGWVAAQDLIAGQDRIAMDIGKASKSGRRRPTIRDTYFTGMRYHPFATKANEDRRVVKHRAIYEAANNGYPLDVFLRFCRESPEVVATMEFVNPKTHHVHHRNHDHFDNAPDNLELMPVRNHLSHHADEANFNQGRVQWDLFLGFDRIGVEPVYDIECEDPHHNFVAEGLVVHNSGKTTLLANMSEQLASVGLKHFVMSIETGSSDYLKRVISVREKKDLNTGDPVPARQLAEITARNLEFISSGVIEFSLYESRLSVEQLMADIRHAVDVLGCRIVFIDNLNFLLRVTRSQDQVVEMDNVIHTLIEFVKTIDVHIWMVMHPKKTENGRVVSEYDIKGSSTSVQEAQNVFLFNKPTPEEIAKKRSPWDRDLTIAKMRRRGAYVGRTMMFRNFGTSYEEEMVAK